MKKGKYMKKGIISRLAFAVVFVGIWGLIFVTAWAMDILFGDWGFIPTIFAIAIMYFSVGKAMSDATDIQIVDEKYKMFGSVGWTDFDGNQCFTDSEGNTLVIHKKREYERLYYRFEIKEVTRNSEDYDNK